MSKTLVFSPFQANPMGGYTAQGGARGSPGEPEGDRGSPGAPWRASGPWGAMWIPRANRVRWKEEHDPIRKPKPGQAVGEFRGQRSAKP